MMLAGYSVTGTRIFPICLIGRMVQEVGLGGEEGMEEGMRVSVCMYVKNGCGGKGRKGRFL